MLFALSSMFHHVTPQKHQAPRFLMMKYRIMLDCQIKDIKILTGFGK